MFCAAKALVETVAIAMAAIADTIVFFILRGRLLPTRDVLTSFLYKTARLFSYKANNKGKGGMLQNTRKKKTKTAKEKGEFCFSALENQENERDQNPKGGNGKGQAARAEIAPNRKEERRACKRSRARNHRQPKNNPTKQRKGKNGHEISYRTACKNEASG